MKKLRTPTLVIPAEAGIPLLNPRAQCRKGSGIPAFAGMTGKWRRGGRMKFTGPLNSGPGVRRGTRGEP
jgi:hypothetical protein